MGAARRRLIEKCCVGGCTPTPQAAHLDIPRFQLVKRRRFRRGCARRWIRRSGRGGAGSRSGCGGVVWPGGATPGGGGGRGGGRGGGGGGRRGRGGGWGGAGAGGEPPGGVRAW